MGSNSHSGMHTLYAQRSSRVSFSCSRPATPFSLYVVPAPLFTHFVSFCAFAKHCLVCPDLAIDYGTPTLSQLSNITYDDARDYCNKKGAAICPLAAHCPRGPYTAPEFSTGSFMM